jgi:hypothetical protein
MMRKRWRYHPKLMVDPSGRLMGIGADDDARTIRLFDFSFGVALLDAHITMSPFDVELRCHRRIDGRHARFSRQNGQRRLDLFHFEHMSRPFLLSSLRRSFYLTGRFGLGSTALTPSFPRGVVGVSGFD